MKDEINIDYLPDEFIGTGKYLGFHFKVIERSNQALLYEVDTGGSKHYETFKIKHVAKCISFEDRVYSEEDYKEIYPKDKDFGKWAWSHYTIFGALKKFNELNQENDQENV